MISFEFVFIVHLMVNLLEKTNTLLVGLQQKSQNMGNLVTMSKVAKDDLKKYKDDDGLEELLGVVTAFCIKDDIFVPKMLVLARYQRRVNGQPKIYYHYFRCDLFSVVLIFLSFHINK